MNSFNEVSYEQLEVGSLAEELAKLQDQYICFKTKGCERLQYGKVLDILVHADNISLKIERMNGEYIPGKGVLHQIKPFDEKYGNTISLVNYSGIAAMHLTNEGKIDLRTLGHT